MFKYGYLFMEYKYYWFEFVKLFLKFSISVISAVYYDFIFIKGVIISLVILIYLSVIFKCNPYKETCNLNLIMN